jgi:hypothetical protein
MHNSTCIFASRIGLRGANNKPNKNQQVAIILQEIFVFFGGILGMANLPHVRSIYGFLSISPLDPHRWYLLFVYGESQIQLKTHIYIYIYGVSPILSSSSTSYKKKKSNYAYLGLNMFLVYTWVLKTLFFGYWVSIRIIDSISILKKDQTSTSVKFSVKKLIVCQVSTLEDWHVF